MSFVDDQSRRAIGLECKSQWQYLCKPMKQEQKMECVCAIFVQLQCSVRVKMHKKEDKIVLKKMFYLEFKMVSGAPG